LSSAGVASSTNQNASRSSSGIPVSTARELYSQSESMARTIELARRVAQADLSVLISGESGVGKEVIARFIHEHSLRANGPFVAINCAAIPEAMMESVLFGHVKGAFTGASDKRVGKFELAHGGTLLLDEITEMPIDLQAKLLRVLQEREVERVGSNQTQRVDVRVLATSNRDLQQAVAQGDIREDLYYRLSVFPLVIPPLRDRPEDILSLANQFVEKYASTRDAYLDDGAQRALINHEWSGNVRELENCIQRALVLCDPATLEGGTAIEATHLALEQASIATVSGVGVAPPVEQDDSLQSQLKTTEETLLLRTLAANGGVRKRTALQLGIAERTLRHKLKQLKERGIL